mmetsp:Transcript_10560/g.23780  ORF Transcript_10560/g.23780 Transcript_10560/m.23780 type:complete len:288 (-) Transcript_10560:189-1052(-)
MVPPPRIGRRCSRWRVTKLPLAALLVASCASIRESGLWSWIVPSTVNFPAKAAPAIGCKARHVLQTRQSRSQRRAGSDRGDLKKALLELVDTAARGADEAQSPAITEAFEALERQNPCEAPLESPLLKGEWELIWTTSTGILGLSRPPPFRPRASKPILQFLDPAAQYARNLEYTWLGKNTVEATIVPLNSSQRGDFTSKLDEFLLFKYGAVDKPGGTYMPEGDQLERSTIGVRFDVFRLFGWLSVKAPESATGILEVTYLDEDLRLSRGDRGNLFVLRRFSDEKVE